MATDLGDWISISDISGYRPTQKILRKYLDILEIGKTLKDGIERGYGKTAFIFDLSQVEHITNDVLVTLVNTQKQLQERGNQYLTVTGTHQTIETFKITRLHKLFDMRSSYEEARKHYESLQPLQNSP